MDESNSLFSKKDLIPIKGIFNYCYRNRDMDDFPDGLIGDIILSGILCYNIAVLGLALGGLGYIGFKGIESLLQ